MRIRRTFALTVLVFMAGTTSTTPKTCLAQERHENDSTHLTQVKAGLSPEEAARAMHVPDGFSVTLFAGEPDVKQPIAMTIDDRGRLWIAEAYSYPIRVANKEARDRILIFEDEDGDGQFDRRKVFLEHLNLVSGLEVGFGGVWIGAAPYLLFVPDRDQDDVPDGPAEMLLDGWGFQDTHETLNALIWGPDGWLYGCHGVFTHSRVGKPGTPNDKRVPLNAAIWRYHPTRHVFEVFAHGTSNPWGVDFDARGQAFCTACVIPHLYHVIQGARYQRQSGNHFNPYTYDDIPTIADHVHWTNEWRDGNDGMGGGHAHAGAMIYQGGSWPDEYRGQLFMNNIHGARINVDALERAGSGFIGRHNSDFLFANDLWSQLIYLRYGPDGQVYMIDWYDKNNCHRRDPDVHDRSNGRIFKVSYGKQDAVQVDLRKLTDQQLAELQLHQNDWYVRHARRLLQERAHTRKPETAVRSTLEQMAFEHQKGSRRLRGLWAMHVYGGLTPAQIQRGLSHSDEDVRAWTIQLALEYGQPGDDTVSQFVRMARHDRSPTVRLYLASALQRMPAALRWDTLAALVMHSEDITDHNLPLMYWYALEPLVPIDRQRSLELATAGATPKVLEHTVRRMASMDDSRALDTLISGLGKAKRVDRQRLILAGLRQAFRGQREAARPDSWPAVFDQLKTGKDPQVRLHAMALGAVFGDAEAIESLREVLRNESDSVSYREQALEALVTVRDQKLRSVLIELLDSPNLRGQSLRALAQFQHAETTKKIITLYPALSVSERRDALYTLASHRDSASALLNALQKGTISDRELTADVVRQLRAIGDDKIHEQLGKVWGAVRESPKIKQQQLSLYRRVIQSRTTGSDDAQLGRAVYARICQQCHRLFAIGGEVGPELTGSNRANLDYLLSNIVDPSALMAKAYQASTIVTSDGRVLTGIVKDPSEEVLVVRTANDTIRVPRAEVEELMPSAKSMMPDDLLAKLERNEIRGLFAYLRGPQQTPMLATPENQATLFNGRDLTGWRGDPQIWSVRNGEIVGHTSGKRVHNQHLISDLTVEDFRLTLEVRISGKGANSGIQFRSRAKSNGSAAGYQADVGPTFWGKLIEDQGRGWLWKKSGEQHVRPDDWNHYEIVANGSHIRTFLNGQPCADFEDSDGARRGIIALQLHTFRKDDNGGPAEVRYRNLKLEVLPTSDIHADESEATH